MFKYIFFILLTTGASTCNQTEQTESNKKNMVEKSAKENDINILHDIWALTEMNGQADLDSVFTQGVPTLEIFVADMKLGGYSGCNNYGASIEKLTEDAISISPMMATKKYCFDVDESGFFKNMGTVNKYKVEKMHLYLYENDTLLLTFKKVD